MVSDRCLSSPWGGQHKRPHAVDCPTLLPKPAQAFLLKSLRNGAANPSLGDVHRYVPLTPTESISLSLFQLSCYLRALPSLPCQPRISLEVLVSLISLLTASQLAALSLLLSCSSCPSTLVPRTGAEVFALQSIATESDYVFCSHLSCLCSPVHLCSGK